MSHGKGCTVNGFIGQDISNDSLNQNISHSQKNLLMVKRKEIVKIFREM